MNYLQLLENSFEVVRTLDECPPKTRHAYLSEYIFDFTTYDDEMADLFGRKALQVCAAINTRRTFEYIKDEEDYKWYLLMCNMPFFCHRIEWGTSVRGAWWDCRTTELDTCGLWDGDDQITHTLYFDDNEWVQFIEAVIAFASEEA